MIDLSKYQNKLSVWNKLGRLIWIFIYYLLFRSLPFNFCFKWRVFLLTMFGARIDYSAHVYATVKIWAPWNLEMGQNSCLGPYVDCYNVAKVHIGANSTISQKTYLCTASHDITKSLNPLIVAPIFIEDQVWVASNAFVGMGVYIKQGAVVGACSAVFKNVESWTVVGGNPAKVIKKRIITE